MVSIAKHLMQERVNVSLLLLVALVMSGVVMSLIVNVVWVVEETLLVLVIGVVVWHVVVVSAFEILSMDVIHWVNVRLVVVFVEIVLQIRVLVRVLVVVEWVFLVLPLVDFI